MKNIKTEVITSTYSMLSWLRSSTTETQAATKHNDLTRCRYWTLRVWQRWHFKQLVSLPAFYPEGGRVCLRVLYVQANTPTARNSRLISAISPHLLCYTAISQVDRPGETFFYSFFFLRHLVGSSGAAAKMIISFLFPHITSTTDKIRTENSMALWVY